MQELFYVCLNCGNCFTLSSDDKQNAAERIQAYEKAEAVKSKEKEEKDKRKKEAEKAKK